MPAQAGRLAPRSADVSFVGGASAAAKMRGTPGHMGVDISDILDDWPYEPGQITARRVRGDDGRDKIQLRLDLGLLQMEVTGRPDGKRPYSYESLLAYYQAQLKLYRDNDDEEDFKLDEQACERLRAEGLMYYHRYLAAFILEDYEIVEADTARSLEMMDLCGKYAAEESDRFVVEQYRPYVLMMRARARARLALADNRPKAALSAVQQAIADVSACFERTGAGERAAQSSELAILQALAAEIEARVPADPVTKLRKQLDEALADERYEDAATIRDQLKRLYPDSSDSPTTRPDEPASQ